LRISVCIGKLCSYLTHPSVLSIKIFSALVMRVNMSSGYAHELVGIEVPTGSILLQCFNKINMLK